MEHGPPHNEHQNQASAQGFKQNQQHAFVPNRKIIVDAGNCRHAGLLCSAVAAAFAAKSSLAHTSAEPIRNHSHTSAHAISTRASAQPIRTTWYFQV